MNHLLLRSRLLPISHSVGRPFSRLPLPSSIPPSSLRPLVAFSPLSASPPHLILPAHTRTIPLASTGQSVKLISDGGPLEQGGRECWVLGNGSLVGWGWHSDEFRPWAEQLLKLKGSKLKGEEEQLDFSVDSEVDAPRFERDVLVLPTSASQSTPTSSPSTPSSSSIPESELTQLLIRYAVSEALSHSSQLNVVEGQLDSLLSKDIDVPSFLAKHGRGPYSRKQVIQRLGEFMEVRQAVSLKGLGDLPDFYWEEPLLESESQIRQTRPSNNTQEAHIKRLQLPFCLTRVLQGHLAAA